MNRRSNDGNGGKGSKGRKQLICDLGGFSQRCRDCLEFEDEGVIYETPKRLGFTCRVVDALEQSKTWGDFRHAMPRSEYRRLLHWSDGFKCDTSRHKSGDPFDPNAIAAYEEGWYPSCLDDVIQAGSLPKDMREKYIRYDSDCVGCASWEYVSAIDVLEVNSELERRGYEVIDYSGIPKEAEDRQVEDEDSEDES